MRILVISNLFPPYILGGYEILCGQVCAELQHRGHEVTVLTSDHGTDPHGCVRGEDTNVSRSLNLYQPFHLPARLARGKRLSVGRANYRVTRAEIDRIKPDLIFVWSLLRLTVGPARAAQDSGIPCVYTFNDENITSYMPAAFGLSPRRLAAYLLDHVVLPETTLRGLAFDHSTCISLRLKENLLKQGFPAKCTRVIYQGIPISRFPLKAQPGSLSCPARVLYTGQLHPYKGVHTLIEAAHIAAANGMNLQVSIVGDGTKEYRNELVALAEKGPAEIHLLGKRSHDEMAEIYRSHDLFVFPSIWPEPFGLTHLEAMASGLPVISTAGGGQGEFLIDGSNALIFPEGDAAALATQLQRLISDPQMAQRLAAQGRLTVEEQFTMEKYVKRLEAFLQDTLTESKA